MSLSSETSTENQEAEQEKPSRQATKQAEEVKDSTKVDTEALTRQMQEILGKNIQDLEDKFELVKKSVVDQVHDLGEAVI